MRISAKNHNAQEIAALAVSLHFPLEIRAKLLRAAQTPVSVADPLARIRAIDSAPTAPRSGMPATAVSAATGVSLPAAQTGRASAEVIARRVEVLALIAFVSLAALAARGCWA